MLYGGVDMVRCCGYLFGTDVQSKIPQSGTTKLQDVAGLPFDVLAARIQPFNWEEFVARIPIQNKKKRSLRVTLSKELRVIFLVTWG